MLTKLEYQRLQQFFNLDNHPATIQTNHYFETKDFQLKANGAALRIRKKNDLWQLTLKQPHTDGLLETHDTLTAEEAHSWINGDIIPKPHVAKQLNQLGIDFAKLHYGGRLQTHRQEVPYQDTIVVLDYNTYNNHVDYELELEAKNFQHGQKVFNQLLIEQQIPKRETDNKIKRFYTTL